MRSEPSVCLTFDVDLTDYLSGQSCDEMDQAFPLIQEALTAHPTISTSWYVRLDAQMEVLYGTGDYVFRQHADKVRWLRENGHEIGWHHHTYRRVNDAWQPETDPALIREEVHRWGQLARAMGLQTARMGWAYHTNETMWTVADLGFASDSSALPRPRYAWEAPPRDWSVTPMAPYRPARADYRRPGAPALPIVEMPMTTVPIPTPGTDAIVQRYINPGYRTKVFQDALAKLPEVDPVVLICHPYETVASASEHGLLAFDPRSFRANLKHLAECFTKFRTISAAAASWRN